MIVEAPRGAAADADAPDAPDAPELAATSVHDRLARRLRALRDERRLSLDGLAARTGVSRSMISLIERGESSPTAAVLDKLAAGLDVPLASLFEDARPASEPVARRAEQPVWRDPASGYARRNLSPAGVASPIQLVEVRFPAGAAVAYEHGARATRVHQQLWVLEGRMDVTVGDAVHHLRAGDCLAFDVDRATAFRNPGTRDARYVVAVVTERSGR